MAKNFLNFIEIRRAFGALFLCALVFASACKESQDLNTIINPENTGAPTPGGGSGSGDSESNLVPSISSIAPNTGIPAGGALVTISGSGFATGATVTFGGTPCDSVLITETAINCVTPAHSAGFVDVAVTNPNNQSSVSANGFYYDPAPTISAITPTASAAAGGGVLTVTGTTLSTSSEVYIDSTLCPLLSAQSTSITCTIPSHPAGTVSVTVQNSDGQSAVLTNSFTYSTGPYLVSISPNVGAIGGGTTITLSASGLTNPSTVKIGGVACGSFTLTTPTTATCITGANSAGTYNVVLADVNNLTSTLNNAYTYQPAPTVTSINPSAGASGGGTAITVNGSGFLTGASVSLGNATCSGVTVVSSTQITCTSSAHSSGGVNVTVTNTDTQVGTLASGYTYQAGPYVSSISPTSGALTGGTSLSVNGTGFLTGATVTVGGSSCLSPSVTATQITCTTSSHSAGTVSVVVTNPDTQTATLANSFVYQSGPSITSVTPTAGPLAGGTTITIAGARFISGLTVTLNGASCGSVLVSSTQVTCVTPANSAGVASLTITNPDTQSATLAGAYTYNPAPTISGITPSAGSTAGGTAVTIAGTNFLSGVTVTVGGVTCTSPLNSSTQINCTTGAHASGNANIVVTNYDGQAATLSAGFSYNPTPTITAISPTAGALAGNTAVTITGTNFLGSTVTLGGSTCTSPTVISTQINCTAPAHAAGAVNLVVTNSDAQTATLTNGYTYQPAPTVFSVSPTAGPLAGGQTVTINGSNFVSGAAVTLGGTACASVSLVSSSQLTCVTPAHAAGQVNLVVTNADTQSGTGTNIYTFQGAPSYSSVSPLGGTPSGGTLITINGAGFVSGATVTLGGSSCSSVNVISSTQLTCTTPAHAAGTVSMVITNSDSQNVNVSNVFTYEGAPSLSAVSPSAGALAGGTVLTLTGTGFISGAQVTIGSASCATLALTSTHITCTTSSNGAGLYSVAVTNPDTQTSALPFAYTYEAAPFISSISPLSGSVNGSTILQINGTGFIGGATATVGGQTCTSPSVTSTQITCVTPAGSAGTASVTVSNPDTQIYTLASAYTYRAAPTVTAVTPTAGPVAGSTSISITGANFLASPVVTVGGTTCSSATQVSSTQITCTTGAHVAGASTIEVINTDGQSGQLSNGFNYLAGPTITSVSPSAGSVNGNTSITIIGSNLSSTDTVSIGSANCGSVSSTASNQLTCVTSANSAQTANVVVTDIYGQNATQNNAYTYQPAPTITSVTPFAGALAGGTSITIVGTGFVSGLSVQIGTGSCTSISSSSTNITCTTPAGTTGQVNVIVTNLDNQSGTKVNGYNYQPAPTITSISPTGGSINGSTSVTVTGTGFHTGAIVTIGTIPCTVGTVSSTQITCTTGAAAAATYAITVTNLDTQTGSLSSAYTYRSPPSVSSISPTKGFLNGGYTLTISGTNFLSGSVSVSMGTQICTSPTVVSSTEITCTVPAVTSAQTIGVTVVNPDSQSSTLNSAFNYTTNGFTQLGIQLGSIASGGAVEGTGNTVRLFTNGNSSGVTSDGNYLYFSDSSNFVIRKISIGTWTSSLVAGQYGSQGASDGTSGGRLYIPGAITIDPTYTYLYFIDTYALRMVTISTGQITTLAGVYNTSGYNNATGTAARFGTSNNFPAGIATDGVNIYIADSGNNTIRQYNIASGAVTTLAGTTTAGAANGTGSLASFSYPKGIAIDNSTPANLYIADYTNCAIRKMVINSTVVTTAFGTLSTCGTADGVGGLINQPSNLAYDGTNLYLSETGGSGGIGTGTVRERIRQLIVSSGNIISLAGSATSFGNIDGTGSAALLNYPYGIWSNGSYVFVLDSGNNNLKELQISSGAVTTVAGISNNFGFENGPQSQATFWGVNGVTLLNGTLYSADTNNMAIRATSLSTLQTSTLAGGSYVYNTDEDGFGGEAKFYYPWGITNDGTYLYVAEYNGDTIRKINPATGQVTTFAGYTITAGSTNGIGSSALFNTPYGITSDGTNLYVCDYGNSTIRKIVIATQAVTTFAGTTGSPGSTNGTGTAAFFNGPKGIVTDGTNLYVAEAGNCDIRVINIATQAVSTLAGLAGTCAYQDGTGTNAHFNAPAGIAFDGTYLYVADSSNHAIRQVTLAGVTTTLAGNPNNGYDSNGGGTLPSAYIRSPSGILWTQYGLFVANSFGIDVLH